jgi:hypothetical protein
VAGVQIGNACWELYTIEHGLSVRTRSCPAAAVRDVAWRDAWTLFSN